MASKRLRDGLVSTKPVRPVKPNDPPLFYRLPAEKLRVRMSTSDGFDVIDRRRDDGDIVYGLAVWPDVWAREERRAKVGALIDLAVWHDTAPDGDGSTLPEAVDVRYRDGVEIDGMFPDTK